MKKDTQALKRVAFSPGEFAEMFGKSQTWGYRQIYAGKVTTITEHGRILIPAHEVERILESAGIYDGKPKPKRGKEKLSDEQQSIWQNFVRMRRQKHEAAASATTGGQSVNKSIAAGRKRARLPARIAGQWRKHPPA